MLNSMVDWSVRNRLLVILGLIAVLIGSVMSIQQLNLDAFPDVTNVQVQVNTEAPGLAAEEVEQLITFPIEAVMYSLPDVEQVRSISKTGLSVISVVFKEGTDITLPASWFLNSCKRLGKIFPTVLAPQKWASTPLG